MQESLTGNDENISIDCFNSKLYTTDSSIMLHLANGKQDGQLKKLTFSFQGVEDTQIRVLCPALIGSFTEITFTNVGDQCFLIWSGQWIVLETINILNPGLNTPVVS
jgi:hypothetical protein